MPDSSDGTGDHFVLADVLRIKSAKRIIGMISGIAEILIYGCPYLLCRSKALQLPEPFSLHRRFDQPDSEQNPRLIG